MFDATHSDTPLQQSREFAAALRHYGADVRLQNGLVILRRRLAGCPVSMVPRFPLRDPGTLRARLPPGPVILSPDAPCPDLAGLGALPVMTPAHVALLDLTGGRDALHRDLHQKWRNRLRHGDRQGLRVTRTTLPDNPDHWLLQAEARQARTRGYRGWPVTLTLAYARANPGRAVLFTALEGGTPVAAMLFLLHGSGATYHIGHSTPRGRATSAHNLLLWRAISWLTGRGMTQLDLGLIDTHTETSAGLARFKLGTGARMHQLGGTWLWWPPARGVFRWLSRLDRADMTPRSTGQPRSVPCI